MWVPKGPARNDDARAEYSPKALTRRLAGLSQLNALTARRRFLLGPAGACCAWDPAPCAQHQHARVCTDRQCSAPAIRQYDRMPDSPYVPNELLGRPIGFRLYSVQFVMDCVQLRLAGFERGELSRLGGGGRVGGAATRPACYARFDREFRSGW